MNVTVMRLWLALSTVAGMAYGHATAVYSISHEHDTLHVRLLQAVTVSEHAFVLNVDFTQFDAAVDAAKTASEEWAVAKDVDDKVSAVKENLEKVKKYIGAFFRVKFKEELKIPKSKCNQNRYAFGPAYVSKTDFYLYVVMENKESSKSPVLAMNCLVENETKRPVVGIMLINMLNSPSSQPSTRQLFRRYLHEFIHMLGYNSYLFQNFPNSNEPSDKPFQPISVMNLSTSVSGSVFKVVYINVPSIVAIARSYFGCPTAAGLPVVFEEDAATVGSHASFLQMPYSIMNKQVPIDSTVDRLTVGYLQSTGWYSLNDSAVEKDVYAGYDAGLSVDGDPCDAVDFVCPAIKNRCSAEQATAAHRQCSADRLSKQTCEVHPNFGKPVEGLECAFWTNTEDYCREGEIHGNWDSDLEEISNSSLCFMAAQGSVVSSNLKASCLKYECISSESKDSNPMMGIKLANSLYVICSSAGIQALPDKSDSAIMVTIDCPNPADFCKSDGLENAIGCPLSCSSNGLGMCMASNECFCFFGTVEGSTECSAYTKEEETTASSRWNLQVLSWVQLGVLGIWVSLSCFG